MMNLIDLKKSKEVRVVQQPAPQGRHINLKNKMLTAFLLLSIIFSSVKIIQAQGVGVPDPGHDWNEIAGIATIGSAGQLLGANATIDGLQYYTVDKSFVGLGNVEDVALSTWAGSNAITTLGTIASGTWNGSPVNDAYISSSANWNSKEPAIPLGVASQYFRGDKTWQTLDKAAVGLNNVENTALSTWAGTSNVTTLGTIISGSWNGSTIGIAFGGTGANTAVLARTNLGVAIGSDVQAYDSDLSAVAGLGSTGLITRTATGAATTRSIISGSTKMIVANGDGISGNPTLDISEPNLTHNNIGGTLGATKGGTGLTAYNAGDTLYASAANTLSALAKGIANQVLGMNAAATGPEYKTILGTANRVTVTNAAGSITLNAPQNIHTAATPTFAGLTLSGLSTGIVHSSAVGVFSSSAADLASADVSGLLPISKGGTGSGTANGAFNALAPNQTGNAGKYLSTDGANTAWTSTSSITSLGTITTGAWNATPITDPYILSAATWNAKENVITFNAPLSRVGNTVSLASANGITNGYLSSADWTIFNNKESALSFNAPLTRIGNTLSLAKSDGSTDGYLSAADWTTFNSKQGLMAKADGTTDGYLAFGDWNLFNNKQDALGFVPENSANKGAVGGYASLDGSGKIPSSQLPALAITNTFVVADDVAKAALSVETGDVAIQTDVSKSFIYDGAAWQELQTPTDTVLSVNGQTGAVTLTTSDINEGSNLYYTDARADARVDAGFIAKNTDNLTEGSSNLYYNITISQVADLVARDALVGMRKGDIAVVADKGLGIPATYIWDGSTWVELL